ncbi:DsbE family thiol:disulfide interchange protein [Algicella marina]|uniref:DsbE family thiol:disulfide interchange protein n=1 Tax=Algicella marina TaxID=2683284 RepID=A0A6P1T0D2_9RHOB|nr:DsbE family thiol:disulfide interchange protein [Algicella marina]QHQ35310.1 DsbE family thiol:disulfide interchange protein [Algicella marina]
MAERKFNWLLVLPPVIFLSLGGLFWLAFQRDNPDELPSTRIGQVAPGMALTTLGDLPLADREALNAPGVKLVNFWASWCGPCRIEHPYLEELAAEGVEIIGVNYKDQPDNALGFLEELGNPYSAVGADDSGRTGIEWGLYGVPETFVVNGAGEVVLRFPGPVNETALENRIRPAMEAAE